MRDNPFPCPRDVPASTWDHHYEAFRDNPPDWDDVMALIHTSAACGKGADIPNLLMICQELRAMEKQRTEEFEAIRREAS
jgi:hypothetical protein